MRAIVLLLVAAVVLVAVTQLDATSLCEHVLGSCS